VPSETPIRSLTRRREAALVYCIVLATVCLSCVFSLSSILPYLLSPSRDAIDKVFGGLLEQYY
jgi:hypothetical protein